VDLATLSWSISPAGSADGAAHSPEAERPVRRGHEANGGFADLSGRLRRWGYLTGLATVGARRLPLRAARPVAYLGTGKRLPRRNGMRWRALIALGLVVAGSALVATAAQAGKPDHRDPVTDLIVRDCAKDDDLDLRYPLRELRRALDALPRHIRRTTRCERVLERAIERARDRLDREVLRIWRDCERDDDLDRDYSRAGLRRALRFLPDDLRMYTDCEAAIEDELDRARERFRREVDRVLRDCERDHDLDRHYSVEALLRALRRSHGDRGCERAIERALRGH
jgi:hypothetical protein